MIEISLGQRLHELRDKADLSLRELARKVGISGPFLSDIELGRRFPSEEILAKLASALNVPLEDLKQHDNREPNSGSQTLDGFRSQTRFCVSERCASANTAEGISWIEDGIRHPVNSVAYVLSGHLTVEKRDTGERRILVPGQALAETVETTHRGFTTDEPVELIVFYAGRSGLPLTINQE